MLLKNIWNNGFDIENFDRRWLILLFFPGIIWFSFQILNSTPYNINKEWYKIHFKEGLKGRVVKKWKDNRSNFIFKLSDSTEGFGYPVSWQKIKIGDSIFKDKNTKKLKIIKRDSIINIDIYEEYKYYDSIYRSEF